MLYNTIFFKVRGDSFCPKSYESMQKDLKKLPKTQAQRQMLMDHFKDILFISKLDTFIQNMIIDSMESRKVENGQVIIKQGEKGDNFYIVEEGEFSILIDDISSKVYFTTF